MYYPYGTVNTAITRTLKITNPLGNLGITEVDINVPAAAAQVVSSGAYVTGFISTGTVATAGSGPWTIVYPGSSSTAVILPAGAAGEISLSFTTEQSETTTGTADAYGLTITVHYSDGSTQSNTVTFYEGSLTTTSVATTVTTATAGTSFTYTVTLGSKDAGLPLVFISDPSVANIGADGFTASFGTPTVTTGSSLTYTSTFSSQEASATAKGDGVTCTDPNCLYFATADIAAAHGPADLNGFITPSFSGTHVTINPAAPTQVKVTLPGTSGGWDQPGHSQDYISTVGPATLGVTLADSFGNGITSSGASGTVTLSALQGTLSATSGTVTNGVLATTITYQPLKAGCSSNCLLQYGTFDLISASLVIPSGPLAGTYAGSSNQLSMGFAYTNTFTASAPTIFRYTSFVGDTTGASGAGNAVAGSTVNLAVTLSGPSGPQKGVPVNFTLTSTSTTTPYTGTFSNGKAWIIVNTNSLGVASANFTADTTSGDAATASYAISAPTSYSTFSATNTVPSSSTGAVTTIAAAGTTLNIKTYSDTGLTTPNSYTKPSGHLYLDVLLQDAYGNSVPWSSSFALQITLATSAGGLSATTVYITSAMSDTYHSGYQVQFTAPATLGTVTLTASTTQLNIAAGSKTIHVVSISPTVSLTPVAKTTLSANTVNVNATGIPSLAAPAGTVVVNFMYSLNGAANLTAGITSTNSTGASFTSFSVTFLNGTNTLSIFATDSNGNVGAATFTFTVTHAPPSATQFTSTGATSTKSGGFTGAGATFTNTGAAKTVNVFFVWYNSANQIVSVGAQLNVAFAAGGSLTFFNSYNSPGTYTVQVFVQDTSGNAVSTSYSVTVTI